MTQNVGLSAWHKLKSVSGLNALLCSILVSRSWKYFDLLSDILLMWSSVAGSGQSQCLLQHKITYCVSVTGTGLTSSSVLIIPSPVMTSCLSCLPATGQV